MQKSDFVGTERTGAVGFVIDNKGYVGTGAASYHGYFKDFWEYNPHTNTWTQKADFTGSPRSYAVAFSIENKGYLGTGYDENQNYLNDFWEFNPITNAWTRLADFPGLARSSATGLAIAGKGYLGLGEFYSGSYYDDLYDFWEFNPLNRTWKRIEDFPGYERHGAVAFVIDDRGFIVGGATYYSETKEVWELNQNK